MADNSNENIENNIPEKGPLNFIVGPLNTIPYYWVTTETKRWKNVESIPNSTTLTIIILYKI